jgi:hypothetical protein
MTLCPKCGNRNEVSLGQTDCSRCGTELSAEPSFKPVTQPPVLNKSPQPSKSFWRFEDRGPASVNGFGTTYYGMRDFRADGSYITTEWIVLAYFPVIPIRSLRVAYRGPGEQRWYLGFVSSKDKFAVFEKRFPPNWKQVLCTYSYLALWVGWIYFTFRSSVLMFPHSLETAPGVTVIFIVCILPVPVPWILRRFAQKRVRGKHNV